MSTGIVLATWFSEHSRSPECADILNSPPEWVSLYPVIIMVVSSTGSTSAQTPAHARVISWKDELSGEGHLCGGGRWLCSRPDTKRPEGRGAAFGLPAFLLDGGCFYHIDATMAASSQCWLRDQGFPRVLQAFVPD